MKLLILLLLVGCSAVVDDIGIAESNDKQPELQSQLELYQPDDVITVCVPLDVAQENRTFVEFYHKKQQWSSFMPGQECFNLTELNWSMWYSSHTKDYDLGFYDIVESGDVVFSFPTGFFNVKIE